MLTVTGVLPFNESFSARLGRFASEKKYPTATNGLALRPTKVTDGDFEPKFCASKRMILTEINLTSKAKGKAKTSPTQKIIMASKLWRRRRLKASLSISAVNVKQAE